MTDKSFMNIEPYNQLHFTNCFLHSFYPIVNYYERSVLSYILSQHYIYSINEHGLLIKKRIVIKEKSEIMKNQGLNESGKYKVEDILDTVQNSLSNGKPVITAIDCFYENIRPDAYNKIHLPHFLLICGYDNSKKEFNILEHEYMDSLQYIKRSIEYDILSAAYFGSLSLFKNSYTYFEYSLEERTQYDKKREDDESYALYIDTLKSCQSDNGSLNSILDFSYNLIHRIDIVQNMDDIIYNFNKIIEATKSERDFFHIYYNMHNDLIESYDTLINEQSIVRGLLNKAKLTGNYDSKRMQNLTDRLKKLYEIELENKNILYKTI